MRNAALLLTATAILGVASLAASAGPAAPAAKAKTANADRIVGVVTFVDAAANSVTISQADGTPVTLTIGPSALISVRSVGSVADIAQTDRVRVTAPADIPAGTTSVTATSIAVLAPLNPRAKTVDAGYKAQHVDGDVVTLNPLTIKTPGGVTVAVATTPTTPVQLMKPGTISDIVVGCRLNATVTGTAPTLVATRITVAPARHAHEGKHHKA